MVGVVLGQYLREWVLSCGMGIHGLGRVSEACESGCGHGRVGVVLEEWLWPLRSGCGPETLGVGPWKSGCGLGEWVWPRRVGVALEE